MLIDKILDSFTNKNPKTYITDLTNIRDNALVVAAGKVSKAEKKWAIYPSILKEVVGIIFEQDLNFFGSNSYR